MPELEPEVGGREPEGMDMIRAAIEVLGIMDGFGNDLASKLTVHVMCLAYLHIMEERMRNQRKTRHERLAFFTKFAERLVDKIDDLDRGMELMEQFERLVRR